jgi:hypothetical protein
MEEVRGEALEARRRRLLDEFKGLFGPAFGPALDAYGRSFSERIGQDKGFRDEVRDRFERGRALGGFPELSALFSVMTPEEQRKFFETGWTRVAWPDPSQNPWDRAPWAGDREAYREDLYSGLAFAFTDLRAFAREWLEELSRVGYYGMEESLGLPIKQQADDLSAMPGPLPLYGEAFPARLGDSGQVVWLILDGPRSPERGYREISLSDEPLRTDSAILAALTSLEGRQLDVGRLRKVLPDIVPSPGETVWDRWTKALAERGQARELLQNLRHHQALDYALMLLRYHRPGFDALPLEQRVELLAETCISVNAFLEALRKLISFLEHGLPGRRGPAPTRLVGRDVQAAVLKDVDGLTYREVAEELGVPLPADFIIKGDHPAVRRMVTRGRAVLESALGGEGWLRQVEAMKAEAARWSSLSEARREAEAEAEALGIPFEEALRRLEDEDQSDDPGRESGTA